MSTVLLDLLVLTATVLTLVLIFMRSRLAVASIYGWAAVRVAVVAFNLHLAWAVRHHALREGWLSNLLARQVGIIAGVAIWLLYFHCSKRVRETFGQNL